MKCTRCRGAAEVQLRAHNSAFCRPCYLLFFRLQVERAVASEKMFTKEERLLIAVSGGKDSLALWDVLVDLGYDTTGLYLGLGIGAYSSRSHDKAAAFAAARGLTLRVVELAEEGPGMAVPAVAGLTRRPACSACGTMKRHYFDQLAIDRGFPVVATGHNLDDEAARLLGNVLHWQMPHLARQRPVLEPTHPRFVRKVKPLFRISEYETAIYSFLRRIDYVVDECPNAVGATQLVYKDMLNRLETASPGSKLTFLQDFLSRAQPELPSANADGPPQTCVQCGMPAFGEVCGYCRLVRETTAKRERRAASGAA